MRQSFLNGASDVLENKARMKYDEIVGIIPAMKQNDFVRILLE